MHLHIVNGDSTRYGLEGSGLTGDIAVWADVLHEGPIPAGLSGDAWRRVRARYLASQGYASEDEVLAKYAEWDAALDRWREYDELVFWVEHDLFDQLLLIRHLHWLTDDSRFSDSGLSDSGIQYSLVQHDEHLGPLKPAQLASLYPHRAPITNAQIETGARAWELFTAPDPMPLVQFWRGDTSPLPYLRSALKRYFEDFPSAKNGLARSEEQILTAVKMGKNSPVRAFLACQQMEEQMFMGDSTFWSLLRRLAEAQRPLITLAAAEEPNNPLPDGRLELTDFGVAVLEGRADHVVENGIDRWSGGVHLTDGRYRWDGRTLIAHR